MIMAFQTRSKNRDRPLLVLAGVPDWAILAAISRAAPALSLRAEERSVNTTGQGGRMVRMESIGRSVIQCNPSRSSCYPVYNVALYTFTVLWCPERLRGGCGVSSYYDGCPWLPRGETRTPHPNPLPRVQGLSIYHLAAAEFPPFGNLPSSGTMWHSRPVGRTRP